jgi:hypothetical protein
VQLKVFKNRNSYQLLGLWEDFNNNQTFQWIAEVPKNVIKTQVPSNVDFPLKPPAAATGIITVKSEKIESLLWTLTLQKDPEASFVRTYTSQGFLGRLWSRQSGKYIFILHKGSEKLLGIVENNGSINTTILMKLNKI